MRDRSYRAQSFFPEMDDGSVPVAPGPFPAVPVDPVAYQDRGRIRQGTKELSFPTFGDIQMQVSRDIDEFFRVTTSAETIVLDILEMNYYGYENVYADPYKLKTQIGEFSFLLSKVGSTLKTQTTLAVNFEQTAQFLRLQEETPQGTEVTPPAD